MIRDPSRPRIAETHHVLLLQFVCFDDPLRQDRTEYYPFFLAQARELGCRAAWLQCGVYSYETSHQNAHLIHIDEAEIRCLVDGIRALGPTHIVVPDLLSDAVQAALREAFPAAQLVNLHDAPVEVQKLPPASWLPGVLGLPTEPWEGQYLADAVTPEYDSWLIPPPEGYTAPPPNLIPIVCGPSCLYAKPVGRNPYFEDVEFGPEVMDLTACTFCARAGGRAYHYRTRPLELALKQVSAAARTRDKAFADMYRIRGAAVALRIGEFLATVLEEDLPPCTFCFEFRIDELLKVAPAIDAALPALRRAGHRLNLYNMGLENFSPVEQARYNKGFTDKELFETVPIVQRWRREYPDSFEFGNYGMVIFTPWTTLEDVRYNLDGIERLRREGIRTGKRYIGSKLQMFREIALYSLAVRDGVEFLDCRWQEGTVVDPETGFFWFNGHAKGHAHVEEIGWRFLHQETADFYEVVWRACMADEVDERAKADPLLVRIGALMAARPDRWPEPLDFVRDALETATSEPRPRGPEEIVARLAERIGPPPPPERKPGAFPDPTTPMERLLVERADRLRHVLERLGSAPRSPLPGWALARFERAYNAGANVLSVELRNGEGRLVLRLRPGDDPRPAFATAPGLKIVHDPETPVESPELTRAVRRLCTALDHYLRMPGPTSQPAAAISEHG